MSNTSMNKPSSNASSHPVYLGIDAGGTFTDFVLIDGAHWQIHKVLSTPDNPAQAIMTGIKDLNLESALANEQLNIIHGSTVATNAALEQKGAKTVYITNKGFGDVLTIGRQARKELYNLNQKPPKPPVPKTYCLEVDTRRDASGQLLVPLSDDTILQLKQAIKTLAPESIAINLLFSFLNEDEELRLQEALENDYFVSRSSFVLPKYKEYERGMATWLNASLGPKVNHYLSHLVTELGNCPLSIMQSSGGTISAQQAANRAVNLLLSGPAGGLSAVRYIAKQCGLDKVMSFDMGGTSTDVALMDGDFELSDEGSINDWPVAIPMLKMQTIGAGGGSIAWIDEGMLLHVGPRSAGSAPGPVCYGKGGAEITVSDANLILGRLRPEAFLGGNMSLDVTATKKAIGKLSAQLAMTELDLAKGIIELAEQQMVKALHSISIQKGHNPKDFTLCCFGGAGGMHVCSLAEKLHMSRALIPENSGVLSAYGMLRAKQQREFTKTHLTLMSEVDATQIDSLFQALEQQGREELVSEHTDPRKVSIKRSLDLRYQGQSFTLNIPYKHDAEESFHQAHQKQYGHRLKQAVELVNLSLSIAIETDNFVTHTANKDKEKPSYTECDLPFETKKVAIYRRDALSQGYSINGPAIIIEAVSTTWLKAGWRASVDEFSHLHLEKVD